MAKPLVAGAGAEPLGEGGIGDGLGGAREQQERQGPRRQDLVAVLQPRSRLQECGQVEEGTLGPAEPQLQQGAAVPGGCVLGIQASKASYSLAGALDLARFSVNVRPVQPGGPGVRARLVEQITRSYSERAGEVSQLLVEISQLQVDLERLRAGRSVSRVRS